MDNRKKLFEIMNKVNSDFILNEDNNQINNISELNDAFIAWFGSLGFTPQTQNKADLVNSISNSLTTLGYK